MFDELNSFDVRSAESGEDIVRSLHTSQDPLLRQLLEWQASSITSEEMDLSNGMLATGISREIASSDRGTAIALARRIDQRAYLRRFCFLRVRHRFGVSSVIGLSCSGML